MTPPDCRSKYHAPSRAEGLDSLSTVRLGMSRLLKQLVRSDSAPTHAMFIIIVIVIVIVMSSSLRPQHKS